MFQQREIYCLIKRLLLIIMLLVSLALGLLDLSVIFLTLEPVRGFGYICIESAPREMLNTVVILYD
jgi:hypothetical protein